MVKGQLAGESDLSVHRLGIRVSNPGSPCLAVCAFFTHRVISLALSEDVRQSLIVPKAGTRAVYHHTQFTQCWGIQPRATCYVHARQAHSYLMYVPSPELLGLTHKVSLTGGIHAVERDGPEVQFWRWGRGKISQTGRQDVATSRCQVSPWPPSWKWELKRGYMRRVRASPQMEGGLNIPSTRPS